jgi:serine/threonine protein kinase
MLELIMTVKEIITYPSIRTVQHLGCRRVRESDIEFDSHMSGFVYKVRVNGLTLIKKEIPGPETIEEFLYEVTALNSMRDSKSIIGFHGVVVDDANQVVKGLLISFADRGALVDLIFDSREPDKPDLTWDVREKWARQIVQGLSDLHEAGFVQGDFTLSNIVIDESDDAKIIDINRRGCPVGWEPPEILPLIDGGQRVSMYIGVKSDLYQLGMVLWALATTDDEPEARRRPLRLKRDLDVPLWYRRIVETCLQDNPRERMHAAALLAMFPEMTCTDTYEKSVPLSIFVNDGTSFDLYATDGSYEPPKTKTVEPKSSWLYSTASDTQATSPSFSDEPSYPPRGRSPPSPWPRHRDLYNPPYNDRNAMWAVPHGVTVGHDGPTVEEATAGNLGDLEATAAFPNGMSMEEDLDLIEADLHRADAGLENEQTQPTGGNSQAQGISVEIAVADPLAMDGVQDEKDMLLVEDEANVLTPTDDSTSNGSSDDTPVAEIPQSNGSTALPMKTPPRNVDAAEGQVDDGVHLVTPVGGGQSMADVLPDPKAKPDTSSGAEPIKSELHSVDHNDDQGAAYTYDSEEVRSKHVAMGLAEDRIPFSNLAVLSQRDLPSTNLPEPPAVRAAD